MFDQEIDLNKQFSAQFRDQIKLFGTVLITIAWQ